LKKTEKAVADFKASNREFIDNPETLLQRKSKKEVNKFLKQVKEFDEHFEHFDEAISEVCKAKLSHSNSCYTDFVVSSLFWLLVTHLHHNTTMLPPFLYVSILVFSLDTDTAVPHCRATATAAMPLPL